MTRATTCWPASISRARDSALTQLICVPPGLVNELRPLVETLVARAVKRGGNRELDDVWDRLSDGRYLLWVADDGDQIVSIGMTALYVDDDGRFCHVAYCSGKLELLHWGLHQLEDYARQEGCKRVRLSGRRGWERICKDYEIVRTTPMMMLEKVVM